MTEQGWSGRQGRPGQGAGHAEIGVVEGVSLAQQGVEGVPAAPEVQGVGGGGRQGEEPEPDGGRAQGEQVPATEAQTQLLGVAQVAQ